MNEPTKYKPVPIGEELKAGDEFLNRDWQKFDPKTQAPCTVQKWDYGFYRRTVKTTNQVKK